MTFSSGVFLFLFLPLVMILYKLGGKNTTYKNAVLLIASLLFYGYGEPLFVFILIASIIVNYFLALFIERYEKCKKALLVIDVCFNIGLLVYFKYLTFILSNLNRIADVAIKKIQLPIGISFFTFQILSYVIDVYRGNVKAQKKLHIVALYVSMFPQLVAGPIVRYNQIEKEILQRNESFSDFAEGSRRFIIGLSKKVILADLLGEVAERIFGAAQVGDIPVMTAWIGAIAYTLEIYYDFSGYSDMAIGLGRCFGFHFEENFVYPYSATSINDFWKRWHISLTNWFRDYVYIPLGGNRVSASRHVFNLFIVWLLTGIWHGAEWTFITWGIIYFVFQTMEKKMLDKIKVPKLIGWLYTMFIVTMCWVIFRADNLTEAVHYLKNMFSSTVGIYNEETSVLAMSCSVLIPIALIFMFPINRLISEKISADKTKKVFTVLNTGVLWLLLAISIIFVVSNTYSPFIYFNF